MGKLTFQTSVLLKMASTEGASHFKKIQITQKIDQELTANTHCLRLLKQVVHSFSFSHGVKMNMFFFYRILAEILSERFS